MAGADVPKGEEPEYRAKRERSEEDDDRERRDDDDKRFRGE
jgi:hypothetical protein